MSRGTLYGKVPMWAVGPGPGGQSLYFAVTIMLTEEVVPVYWSPHIGWGRPEGSPNEQL